MPALTTKTATNVSRSVKNAPIHIQIRELVEDQANEAICRHASNQAKCEQFVERLNR